MWRGISPSVEANSAILFNNGNAETPATVSAETGFGKVKMAFRYEPQPEFSGPVPFNAAPSTTSIMGITAEVSINNEIATVVHMRDGAPNEMQAFNEPGHKPINLPVSVYLNRKTIDFPNEVSERFSAAVRKKMKGDVIKLVREIEPRVYDLELLQYSGNLSLFATLDDLDGVKIPSSFLSDGASTILSIGLAIITSSGGAVIVDELDSAVHYSKLKTMWATLAALAEKHDVQIFLATHSREAIQSVSDALHGINLQRNLMYIRLDRQNDLIKATSYSAEELKTALNEEWEVR